MKEDILLFDKLVGTVAALRGENGCPWDKKQTTRSLQKYLAEEFAEIVAAIENQDYENLCEELGDFLYLILMLAEINSQQERFTLADVLVSIERKLVRRHPHVFGDKPISDEATLRKQWQEIKAAEKAGREK